MAWTATLGDSEAFAIGNFSGEAKIVPLSYVRDWSHPKETSRGVIGVEKYLRQEVKYKKGQGKPLDSLEKKFNNAEESNGLIQFLNRLKSKWMNAKEPKFLRFPPIKGINVSRALGDSFVKSIAGDHSTISNAPLITVFPLNTSFKIVIACDGLTDFLKPKQMLETVKQTGEDKDLSLELTNKALANMVGENGDNVTVITATLKQG
jgi:hypothetical protein